jgi:RsiW-degrading membrane proteinase PrsW (M82 family)
MAQGFETQTSPSLDEHTPWWQVLLIGLLLYGLGMAVLVVTENRTLFPMVILLGAFAVPVTFVKFFYDHRRQSEITIATVAMTFFYGGVFGAFIAALLGQWVLLGTDPMSMGLANWGTVGLIEEFAKIIAVLGIALHRRHTSQTNGIILGAAAGMGFATLESVGYAFNVFLMGGGNLYGALSLTAVRGLLSPVGHGAWTAILAAVLFRESRPGRFRFTPTVLFAYLAVAGLHAMWNAIPGLLSSYAEGPMAQLVGEAVVGAIGVILLWWLWRDARRRALAQSADEIAV